MKIHIYKNSLPVSFLDTFLKSLSLDEESMICIKMSPSPGKSKFVNGFLPKVARSYSFMGLRGLFIAKSVYSFELKDIVYSILRSYENDVSIVELTKDWYMSYVDGMPFLLLKKKRCLSYYDYVVCFPGAPCKPYSKTSDRHPLYRFTMEWCHYEDSFDFYKDYVLVDSLIGLKSFFLNENELESVYDIDNIICWRPSLIERFLFKSHYLKKINSCLNGDRSYRVPEKYSVIVKKHSWFYMYVSENSDKGVISLHKRYNLHLIKKIFLKHKNRIQFIFTDKAKRLSSPDDCHSFAKHIMNCLPSNVECTSYCQIAFNERNAVPIDTDLAYGHDVYAESLCIGMMQIFFYDGDQVIRLSVYNHNAGMFLLCGPVDSDIYQLIGDAILSYEKQ